MATELSMRTTSLIEKSFPTESQEDVKNTLIENVGETLAFSERSTPECLERIRFAVVKLTLEDNYSLEQAVELANLDWRDLLVNAGFGLDVKRHEQWFESVMR